MEAALTALGVVLTAAALAFLLRRHWRLDRPRRYPAHGAVGLAIIGAASLLAGFRVYPLTVYVTPIFWTGYILAVDAAVYAHRGRSWLATEPRSLGWAALLSVPLWLVFEAYNLRLQNWVYVGLPEAPALRYAGYFWSFATIWPAILETAEFLLVTSPQRPGHRPIALPRTALVVSGGLAVIAPVLAPRHLGAYLFGLVWLGFALLLDPLNQKEGRASVAADLEQGFRGRLRALLAAGLICGFFWEFWNFWAQAKWLYVFPILQQAKIFEMPAPGYLGFPAFAVEVFAMYVYATGRLRVPYYEVR